MPRPLISPKCHGGVTAEALVLLPILTLIFGSVMYMAYRYQVEIRINRQARAEMWRQALPGCVSGVPDSQRLAHVSTVSSRLPIVAPSIGTWLSTVVWEGIDTRVEADVSRPAILEGGTKRLVATTHVTCNEVVRPIEQDLERIIQEAFCASGVC